MTDPSPGRPAVGPLLLIAAIALRRGRLPRARRRRLAPGVTGATPRRRRRPRIPLAPAPLHADPFSLLSWLFTPIFQVFFITLVLLDRLTGNIAHRDHPADDRDHGSLLIPIFRRQIVSTRRMQLIAPEIKEIQRRYKGDRAKIQQATRPALQGARRPPRSAACRSSSRCSC